MMRDPGQKEVSGRIGVLDVLRGIALLGMFLVHFKDRSYDSPGIGEIYKTFVYWFFDERFWAMFGILFGVGFAIQFRNAQARGDPYIAKYLRRMAALAVFGFIAEVFFGFNVLLSYAIWGIPLILFRNWRTPALIVAVLLSATSHAIYSNARQSYIISTDGQDRFVAQQDSIKEYNQAYNKQYRIAQDSKSYPEVVKSRIDHMGWFYRQWFSFLPVNTLTLFLLGLLGLRLGIFDKPEDHRRLIVALMVFGVVSWAADMWLIPNGYGLLRTMWLTFTYIGGVLLLVAHDKRWLDRLSAFGYTGRMALTNYMVQIAMLDLLFSDYAVGLSIHPVVGLVGAVTLFLVDAALSKWWLSRHRYGPLEWVWRAVTYWQQPTQELGRGLMRIQN
jgi:uncharacterized protein